MRKLTVLARLRAMAEERVLSNVLFHDEIEPRDVPGLLAQCHVGLVMLDPRHKTHNVPGTFLTYMQAGLPVLARINEGNDLADLIAVEKVGRAYVGASVDEFQVLADEVCSLDSVATAERAKALSDRLYSSRAAVEQITCRPFHTDRFSLARPVPDLIHRPTKLVLAG